MTNQHLAFQRSASLLLTFGIAFSQVAAYADNEPLVAQLPTGTPVLQGRVSNVDSLSRDILKDEIKLEKYNLSYRLNAAKQGRWKGWRYFFFQECALGLGEASLIGNNAYRGKHLHITNVAPANYGFQTAAFIGTGFASIAPGTGFSPPKATFGPRHTNRPPILAGEVYIPGIISSFFSGSGDAIELTINLWHMWENHHKGFSQAQSRKYVAGLVAGIDKKMAEREAAIRQEPAADSDTAQLQALEGKVLADFRDLSISEFERFHSGAARVLGRENSFYMLDFAKNTLIAYATWEVMSYVFRKHNRGIGDISICNTISSAMIMLDPIWSRMIGNAAVAIDKRNMAKAGLPGFAESAARLKSDFSSMQAFAAAHRSSEKPEVNAAIARMDAYDANNAYYVGEAQKAAAEVRRGQKAAMQNMGLGLYVGGSRLYLGIGGDYLAAYHQHQRGPATFVNLSGKPIFVPFANAVAGPTTVAPGATVATPIASAPAGLTLVTFGSPKASPTAVGTFGNVSPTTGKPTTPPGNGGLPGGAGVWNGRLVNEWLFTAGMIGLPANSISILESIRGRLTGEATYQRAKRNHTLPGQIIRARMAQLDQMDAKI